MSDYSTCGIWYSYFNCQAICTDTILFNSATVVKAKVNKVVPVLNSKAIKVYPLLH